jgi:hypothetical protein
MSAAALLLCLASISASAAPLRLEVLLNKPMARQAGLGALTGSFAVTPGRLVLLGERAKTFVLGWGGMRPVADLDGLDAMAYTSDGFLMAVRGRELVILDAKDGLKKLFTLPSAGMGLAAGAKDRMFLFERRAGGHSGLYELRPGRKIVKLLESPEPIGGAAQSADGRIVLAAGGSLFEFAPGKPMRLLAGGVKPIGSVAMGPGGRVYASDGASVFALDDDKLTLLTKEAGGELSWLDGGLLVFDPKLPLLARVVGL